MPPLATFTVSPVTVVYPALDAQVEKVLANLMSLQEHLAKGNCHLPSEEPANKARDIRKLVFAEPFPNCVSSRCHGGQLPLRSLPNKHFLQYQFLYPEGHPSLELHFEHFAVINLLHLPFPNQ